MGNRRRHVVGVLGVVYPHEGNQPVPNNENGVSLEVVAPPRMVGSAVEVERLPDDTFWRAGALPRPSDALKAHFDIDTAEN